ILLSENDGPTQETLAVFTYLLSDNESWFRLTESSNDVQLDTWNGPIAAYAEPIPSDRANAEVFSFLYLVEPGTVQSIREEEARILSDGTEVRVFQIEMRTGVLKSIGVMSDTGIGEGTDNNITSSFNGLGAISADTS